MNWSQHAGSFEKMKDFISLLLVQTAFRMDSATREWNSSSPNWILKTGEWRDQMLSILLVQRQASLHLGGDLCQPPAQTTLKWQQSSNCCIFSAGMPLNRVSLHINSNTNPKKKKTPTTTMHQSHITGIMCFLKETLHLNRVRLSLNWGR